MANRFSIKVLCSAIQSKLQEIKHKLTARKNISAVGYLTTDEMVAADVAKDKYNGSPVLYIGETNNKFINGHIYVAKSISMYGWAGGGFSAYGWFTKSLTPSEGDIAYKADEEGNINLEDEYTTVRDYSPDEGIRLKNGYISDYRERNSSIDTSIDGWIDLTPSSDNNFVRVTAYETTYSEIIDIVNSGKVPYVISTYNSPYGPSNKVFFYSELPEQDKERKYLYFMSMDGDKYEVDSWYSAWTYTDHPEFQESQYKKEEYSVGDSFEDKEFYPSINYMNDFAKMKCSYIRVLMRSAANPTQVVEYNLYNSIIDSLADTLTVNGIRYSLYNNQFVQEDGLVTYKLLKYTSDTKLSSLLYLDKNGNITPVTLGTGLSIKNNVISASGSSSNGSACVIWTLEISITEGNNLWDGRGLTADMLSGPVIKGTTTGLHLPGLGLDGFGRISVYGDSGRKWIIQATVFLNGGLTADANRLVQWGHDSRVQLLGAATRSFVVGHGDTLDGGGIRLCEGYTSASGKLIIEFACQVES